MGTRIGPYKADFPEGTWVQIKPREFLEEFKRTWKYHNPLQDLHLEYASHTARVLAVGYYFGGDELYILNGVGGKWHECCLDAIKALDPSPSDSHS